MGEVRLADGKMGLGVRAKMSVESLEAYESQVISGASTMRVRDLASLQETSEHLLSSARVSGVEAVFLDLYQRDRADPFSMESQVKKVLKELENHPQWRGKFEVAWVLNRVELLEGALNDVKSSLWQSILITFGVILLFLRVWGRSALISITIPLTLMLTVGLLALGGYTLNVMSLSGLILGIGMVVDNVILIVDRTIELRQGGSPFPRAIAGAVAQSSPALTMATLTNGIIFLPVAFSDSEDNFVTLLKSFQAPILATLIASLILAVFVLPALLRPFASMFGTHENERVSLRAVNGFEFIFKHRKLTAALAFCFILFVGERIGKLNQTDLESPNDPWATVQVYFGDEVPIEERRGEFDRIEREILKVAHQKWAIKTIASSFSPTQEVGSLQLYPLTDGDPEEATLSLQRVVRNWASDFSVKAGVRVQVGDETLGGFTKTGASEFFKFEGPKSQELDTQLATLQETLKKIPGVHQVLNEREVFGQRTMFFVPHELQLHKMGLSFEDIARQVGASNARFEVGPFLHHGKRLGIKINIKPSLREEDWGLSEFRNLQVRSQQAKWISLGALGYFQENRETIVLNRKVGLSKTHLKVEFEKAKASPETEKASLEVNRKIANYEFQPGYQVEKSELNEKLEKMQKNMIFMIMLSSVLIYLLIGASFESVLLPLIVLFAIPSAILSGVFGLWMTGKDFDVMARLSLVILVGIGVNNAILLLDLVEELRGQGYSLRDSVVQACARRWRAVLMTTTIQVLGVLPVALGNSKIMGIPYSSLGVTVMSGMIFSTASTFLTLPFLYELFSTNRASDVQRDRVKEAYAPEQEAGFGLLE